MAYRIAFAVVRNVHERQLKAAPEAVGDLIDSLARSADRLWPGERWPRLRLDRPLQVGARGGHGPIRYHVEQYTPGTAVRFRFEAPDGFDGYHEFTVIPSAGGGSLLRHSLVMQVRRFARLSWPLVYCPLHDALLEDSLDEAEHGSLPATPGDRRWSGRVRLLRAIGRRVSLHRRG